MEFLLTPNNINVFARRPNGKTPIKQGNNFGFDGDDPIEFEDADSTLHFFFREIMLMPQPTALPTSRIA